MLNTINISNTDDTIKEQLFTLCDHYSEFNECCAFFCAAASLVIHNDDVDVNKAAASGAARFAQALMEKSQHINDQLQRMLREVRRE